MKPPANPELEAVPRSWPVLVGLGLVTALLITMFGADLILARRVASRTSSIVDDDQRSIELVDDLRDQAERIAAPGLSEASMVLIAEQIAEDARAYEPLTAQPGEREEWRRLQSAIADLQTHVRAHDEEGMGERIAAIHERVHRLSVINREAAHQQAKAIREVHLKAILVDAAVGLLALFAVATIVLYVLRILTRQRALVQRHISLLSERNRELDAFAGRAAHDLRVPLNPIRGYADLLMTGAETPESVKKMAGRIRVAVDRMSRVVEDMLELSRAGSPAAGTASPALVAADVLEELQPQLADATVRRELADVPVACPPSVLAQLLRNLISNAIKFRARQRPLVLVLRTVVNASTVDLTVEDNGLGINEQDAAHAFEPYYRGSEHREVPGHGLGLAIVHRTMDALGGSCRLERSALEGTAVTLTLPRSA